MRTLRIQLLVAMVAASLLIGCKNGENSITGSFGNAYLSGQVAMSGALEGSSPAGIEVRVVGTGMAMTVDKDGAFAFAGVPQNVTLQLTRESDGISEQMEVESAANLIIKVQKTNPGRKRGSSHPVVEIEGLITVISPTSITVHDSHGADVTSAITPETIIRKGSTTVLPADLKVNDRVHVKASKASDGSLTAVQIVLQNPEGEGKDDESPSAQTEGIIKSVTASSITVLDSHGVNVTAAISATTTIRKGNRTLTAADLKAGQRVHMTSSVAADGTRTAIEIKLQEEDG